MKAGVGGGGGGGGRGSPSQSGIKRGGLTNPPGYRPAYTHGHMHIHTHANTRIHTHNAMKVKVFNGQGGVPGGRLVGVIYMQRRAAEPRGLTTAPALSVPRLPAQTIYKSPLSLTMW